MKIENTFARLMRNTGPARFLVPLGIILIVFGVIMSGMNTGSFELTTGRITSVTEVDSTENDKQYDVGITYTVNGTTYNSVFPNLLGEYTVGDSIDVYYDPEDPESITNGKIGGFVAPAMIGVGALAVAGGIYTAVKAFRKSRELDETMPDDGFPVTGFDGFKEATGVSEYYFRFDGNALKPGYLLEDADRNILFEGKMLKNNLVGPRTFEFSDHTNGFTQEHEVGHTTTTSYNNEFFSVSSWFKFDGKNIWDILHDRGLRLNTDMHSKFPYLIYLVTRDGVPFARFETSSIYVHEDEEAQHKLVIPYGRMYYRCWTGTDDIETLFLTMFAVSESEQTVVE